MSGSTLIVIDSATTGRLPAGQLAAVVTTTPTGGRELKKVTVVVYEVKSGMVGSVLTCEASTFDQAQG